MRETEDLSHRCLVLTSSETRWRTLLEPAVARACARDGEGLEPTRVDPRDARAVASERTLDALEYGALVVAELTDVSAPLFALLTWVGRTRPGSVVLLRAGAVALPFELHDQPVRSYDPDDAAEAPRTRERLAEWAAAGANARSRARPGSADLGSRAGHVAWRRRRERNGVAECLREADRCLLAGDALGALAHLPPALDAEPQAPDLLLRAALLLRDSARWLDAVPLLERAVAEDPGGAPAWRELGIARERAGLPGVDEALRRAVDLTGDFGALVALGRRRGLGGDPSEALRLLERAVEACEGHLGLVLPTVVLRAGRDRCVDLPRRERALVEQVLEVRRLQAESRPPQDGPWSFFDAVTALLVLDEPVEAEALAAKARAEVHAGWETETFAKTLDALEAAGRPTAGVRSALGMTARRSSVVMPAPKGEPRRTFRAEAREPAWFATNVPCATACPLGTDSGGYVSLLARGRLEDAWRVARGPNPFASVCGRICAAPCEDACRRGKADAPVAIRPLKRFLAERHGAESPAPLATGLDGAKAPCMESEAYSSHLRKLGAGRATGRRVAVVGGGPAGLACAHDLAFLGYDVTVFEATSSLGGMMRHGIPEYRLPREVLDAEIASILALGVHVELDSPVTAERSVDSLFARGFESVFLASGAGRGRDLEVEGANLDGVVRAIDYLINHHAGGSAPGFKMELGSRVVVMGGGNVALDVARTARRGRAAGTLGREGKADAETTFGPSLPGAALRAALASSGGADGPREVHCVARQPLGQWPAQKSVHGREEVEEAVREGVLLHPLRGIRRILGRDGKVVGVELAEVVRLTDERGRYAPLYGAHAAEEIACDAVILAVGQGADLEYLEGSSGVKVSAAGFIDVDAKTLATSRPGVFAGGDAAFGPRTLIEGIADGKRAARAIHAHLAGKRTLPVEVTFTEVHPREVAVDEGCDLVPRRNPPSIAVARRTGIAEVETDYDPEEARRQASRCYSCHVQTVYDGSLCVACGRCTDACPVGCLSFVSPADVECVGLRVPDEDGVAVLIKDEERCLRCGLCAERCPTGAMRMERFDLSAKAVPA